MTSARGLTVLAALVLGLLMNTATAHACRCRPMVSVVPADGAENVPLDIAPIVRGQFFDPAAIRFRDEDGGDVPFTVSRQGAGLESCSGVVVELFPSEPLAPNTRYVIRVVQRQGSEPGDAFHFTTGDTKVDATLVPPTLTATLVTDGLRDSCSSGLGGCLDVGDVEAEVTFLDQFGELLGWTLTRGASTIEVGPPAATVCVEARARDAAGRRSAATRVCGSELGLRPPGPETYDSQRRLRCVGGQLPGVTRVDLTNSPVEGDEGASRSNQASGCSAGGTPRAGIELLALVVLTRCVRRRRRAR
jgi:hypothetical protein